jgi:transposase
MNSLYGAIDLHSNNNVVVVMDGEDHVVFEKRLPNDLAFVVEHLAPYREALVGVAVESTYNWYWLVDGLMEAGHKVHLVNTSAVKVYEGLKYTSDEHDARHLAHLLRLGILPEGYIYPKGERSIRDLLRKRSQLVRQKTAQCLSLQNLVSRNTGQGISKERLQGLTEDDLLELSGGDRWRGMALASGLTVFRCLAEQIKSLEQTALQQAKLNPAMEFLLSVDGIGKILGMTILLETGDIGRFKEVGHYASYSRCVDSRRISNAKKKGEGNRKNGNKYLGWAYVEGAHYAVRYSERIRRFFQRKKAKTNTTVAIKTVAHKLARACYYVIKDQVPFEVERAFS